jgi:hypothetical protein
VIGSGIMAERLALAGGNVAIALLGNALATGAMLLVLITMLAPISGARLVGEIVFPDTSKEAVWAASAHYPNPIVFLRTSFVVSLGLMSRVAYWRVGRENGTARFPLSQCVLQVEQSNGAGLPEDHNPPPDRTFRDSL